MSGERVPSLVRGFSLMRNKSFSRGGHIYQAI